MARRMLPLRVSPQLNEVTDELPGIVHDVVDHHFVNRHRSCRRLHGRLQICFPSRIAAGAIGTPPAAIERGRRRREHSTRRRTMSGRERHSQTEVATRSPAMQRALDALSLAARSQAPIMLRAEIGSEVAALARLAHDSSRARKRPFLRRAATAARGVDYTRMVLNPPRSLDGSRGRPR